MLRLSSNLLDLLKQWSSRGEGSSSRSEGDEGSCGISAEERQLAKQLHDDFSRFPPAELSTAPQLSADSQLTTVQDDGDEDDAGPASEVVHDKTQVGMRIDLGREGYEHGIKKELITQEQGQALSDLRWLLCR